MGQKDLVDSDCPMTAVYLVKPGRPLATGEALGDSNTCRVIELVFSVGVHDQSVVQVRPVHMSPMSPSNIITGF